MTDPHVNNVSGDAKPPARAKWFRYTEASSLGLEIVVAILVGSLAGHLLERNVTHWSPWTTLIGVFVGIGAAINAIVRTTREFKRRASTDASERGQPP